MDITSVLIFQTEEKIGDIYICSLDEEAQSFCPTFPNKICLKQKDCKPTFDLILNRNYQGLKDFERCFDFTDVSYLCPLPESPKVLDPSEPANEQSKRDAYFAKLRHICGMAGKLLIYSKWWYSATHFCITNLINS